jgi:hypothetical protein
MNRTNCRVGELSRRLERGVAWISRRNLPNLPAAWNRSKEAPWLDERSVAWWPVREWRGRDWAISPASGSIGLIVCSLNRLGSAVIGGHFDKMAAVLGCRQCFIGQIFTWCGHRCLYRTRRSCYWLQLSTDSTDVRAVIVRRACGPEINRKRSRPLGTPIDWNEVWLWKTSA